MNLGLIHEELRTTKDQKMYDTYQKRCRLHGQCSYPGNPAQILVLKDPHYPYSGAQHPWTHRAGHPLRAPSCSFDDLSEIGEIDVLDSSCPE